MATMSAVAVGSMPGAAVLMAAAVQPREPDVTVVLKLSMASCRAVAIFGNVCKMVVGPVVVQLIMRSLSKPQ